MVELSLSDTIRFSIPKNRNVKDFLYTIGESLKNPIRHNKPDKLFDKHKILQSGWTKRLYT